MLVTLQLVFAPTMFLNQSKCQHHETIFSSLPCIWYLLKTLANFVAQCPKGLINCSLNVYLLTLLSQEGENIHNSFNQDFQNRSYNFFFKSRIKDLMLEFASAVRGFK